MYRDSRGVLIRAVHLKFSKTNYDVIFGEEKKFRQRLEATAEGPFTTVRTLHTYTLYFSFSYKII